MLKQEKQVYRVVELVKQYCPEWEINSTPEGDYICLREVEGHKVTVRFLEVSRDKEKNYTSRVLIYDTRYEDKDPIFRGRMNISNDTSIMRVINEWNANRNDKWEDMPRHVISLIKNFDHALHRQAFEGANIPLLTLAKFVEAFPESKPPLVEGLINQAELIMIYGPTGHGVTTLMLNIAAHAMFGKKFLGFEIPRPIPNIGYLHFEGWPLDMKAKANKLAREFSGFPNKLYYLREYSLKITDPDGEATLRNIITNRELELLFIDNLVNYIGGDVNINDPGSVTDLVMNRLSNVSGSTGCAIVFAWHTGQATMGKRSGRLEHPRRPMGSVEFAGHSDLTARYAKDPDRDGVRIFECTEEDKRRATNKSPFKIVTELNPLTELITFADMGTEQEDITPSISPEDIRSIREDLRLSQEAFGKKIGANERSVGRWERGQAKPEDKYRKAIRELQMKKGDTL